MTYNYRGIEYNITYTDLHDRKGYKCRGLQLKNIHNKGWYFIVLYRLDKDNFPIDFEDNGGSFPKGDQLEVLIQSLKS